MPNPTLSTHREAPKPRAPLHLTMAFDGDALVLGAGTALAVADRRLFLTRRDGEAFDEARVSAPLAVACGRAIAPSELRYVREALRRRSEGETTLALTHLALANLPKLQPPDEAAWRLSAADGLLKGGMSPTAMLLALGLAPAAAAVVEQAYNPDQPRVPAGNGRTSGQWTDEDGGGGADEAPVDSQSDGETKPAGVQIASNSDDWAQYLDPVGSAEAANNDWRAGSGLAPNSRHDLGVAKAVAKFRANGYEILSENAVSVIVPGFSTPRIVDFVARNPADGQVVAGEVKTTISDTIFLNPQQVDKDVAIYKTQSAVAPNLGDGVIINRISYITFCFACSAIDLRSYYLAAKLRKAGIQIFQEYLLNPDDIQ